jgi:viroplasmin and RNaseH domain-containing protein
MRNKVFRLKQKAKYRRKARELVKKHFITREEFKNSINNSYTTFAKHYSSYQELVDDWAKDHEKNRKKCSCHLCRNNRHNKLLDVKDRMTIQERKALDEARFELEEFKESA